MNFGGIGWLLGHELTHAFDNIGRKYDINGNMVNWWSKKDELKFMHRTECLTEEYNHFRVGEDNVSLIP